MATTVLGGTTGSAVVTGDKTFTNWAGSTGYTLQSDGSYLSPDGTTSISRGDLLARGLSPDDAWTGDNTPSVIAGDGTTTNVLSSDANAVSLNPDSNQTTTKVLSDATADTGSILPTVYTSGATAGIVGDGSPAISDSGATAPVVTATNTSSPSINNAGAAAGAVLSANNSTAADTTWDFNSWDWSDSKAVLKNLLASYQTSYNEAKAANENRYNEILSGYNNLYNQQAGLISSLGESQIADVRRQFANTGTAEQQKLVNSGLSGSTISPAVASGNALNESYAEANIQNYLTQQKLNYLGTVQNNMLNFMANREDTYPDLSSLVSLASSIGQGGDTDAYSATYGSGGTSTTVNNTYNSGGGVTYNNYSGASGGTSGTKKSNTTPTNPTPSSDNSSQGVNYDGKATQYTPTIPDDAIIYNDAEGNVWQQTGNGTPICLGKQVSNGSGAVTLEDSNGVCWTRNGNEWAISDREGNITTPNEDGTVTTGTEDGTMAYDPSTGEWSFSGNDSVGNSTGDEDDTSGMGGDGSDPIGDTSDDGASDQIGDSDAGTSDSTTEDGTGTDGESTGGGLVIPDSGQPSLYQQWRSAQDAYAAEPTSANYWACESAWMAYCRG